MNIRKISFYLLGGLLATLSLVFLLLPFKSGAANNDQNEHTQSSKHDGPSNYDALADSPGRTNKNEQTDEQNASAQKLEGGRLVQVERRFDVPTFLWASDTTAAKSGQTGKVGGRSKDAAATAGRSHLGQYASRYRLKKTDVAEAKVASVHDTGKGAIIVKFKQAVGGVEVFRDEINVIMNRDFQLVALSGYLTGDNTGDNFAPQDFQLQPEDAVAKAVADLTGRSFDASVLQRVDRTDQKTGDSIAAESFYSHFNADNAALKNFAFGEEPSRAKKVMFHLPGGYVPAYYVETDVFLPAITNILSVSGEPQTIERAYSYVISAVDGTILFRNNLIDHQTHSYRVWADPVTKLPYDSPAGNDPQPKLNPIPDGAQYPFVAQQDVTLQNYPFSRNDPWLPASATETVGNNVDAYVNLINGIAPGYTQTTTDNGYGPVAAAPYSGTRTFAQGGGDFRAKATAPGAFLNGHVADTDASTAEARQSNVQQLFYNTNFLHDWFYDSGFDEASGNAQADNFGRGGLANDSMKAQAQDVASRNNANMLTPADGARPRMRMYIFNTNAPKYLEVLSPAAIAGRRAVGTSQSGPQSFNATANIVYAEPNNACTPLTNAAAIAGNIAMFQYPATLPAGCNINVMITNAQNAGAVGMVLVWVASNPTAAVNVTGANAAHTAPFLSISFNNADGIKTQLANGQTVSVQMRRDAGADRDGTIDNQIVFHEWGHFISNRLVGNANGINTNHSGGMGEGWGDFLGMLLTVRADDINVPSNANWEGAYGIANYATSGGENQGYYYGIRRVAYSTDLAKNALTFRHIADNQPLPTTAPMIAVGPNSQVHNTGEVWATMLWEAYASLLRDTQGATPRLTFDEAQGRMKLYLTAAFKMTPVSPTFLEARDALIASARAYDVTDSERFAEAFAKRGAGTGAIAPDRYSTNNNGVVESFVSGGALTYVGAKLDDSVYSCDNDGYLDGGEKGRLTVTLKNSGQEDLTNTTATISSSNSLIMFPNGNTITFPASQINQNFSGSVIVEATGGLSGIQDTDFTISFSDPGTVVSGAITAHHLSRFNIDETPAVSATDNVESGQSVWTNAASPTFGNIAPWERRSQSETSLNHFWNGPNAGAGSDQYFISPTITVNGGGSLNLQFDHSWSFESDATSNYDGGVIEMSVNGGAWTDIGTSAYNGTLVNYTGNVNPLKTRPAFVRTSGGTIHTSLTQAVAPGSTVQVRFRIGTDSAVGATGWNVDNIAFSGIVETPFGTFVAETSNCIAPAVITVTPTGLPVGFVGTPYNVTLTPTGGAAPYSYSIVQPYTLPPGLAFSNVAGNLQISGTPSLRGSYPVTFRITDSNNVQVKVSYALVIDTPTRAISGLVTYGNVLSGDPVKYVPDVNLAATGNSTDSATSNSSGAYSLSSLMTNGNYTITPTKNGGMNGVNSLDATRIQQHLVGLINLTPNQMIAADTDNSGSVNSLDATRIQQHQVGIQSTHMIGQWKFLPASKQYNSVSSNLTGENYQAVLVGEVSGNWSSGSNFAAEVEEELLPSSQQINASGRFENELGKQISTRMKQSADSQSAVMGGVSVAVSLPSNAIASTGSTVTIPVSIGALPAGTSIESFDFSVFFDPTVLQPVATPNTVSNTGTLSAACSVFGNSPSAGRVIVSAACGNPPITTGSGVLVNLRFNVIGAANQTSVLTFTDPTTSTNTFQFNNGSPSASTMNGQFTVFGPTAANVTVSGRVTNASGRSISGVLITMTDSNGNQKQAQTTSFGYYKFDNVIAGETVTLTAKSRRYRFNQSSIVRTTNDSVSNADFVATN